MEIDSNSTGVNALGGNSVSGPTTDLDRDAFMRLLVTQIRNQDPMDPMDTRDMMAQLTQLTSVEHLIGIEERLGTLQVGTASIANAQVASFVGKTVTADTSHLRVEEAGSIDGAYELEGHATSVTATIRDEDGRVVRTMELGEQYAGARTFTWDGNNDDGVRVREGRYRVEIEATAENGATVASHTQVRGTVTGVSYENGYPELILAGEYRVLMGDVREVSDPVPSSATTGTGATTTSSGATTTATSTTTSTSTTSADGTPDGADTSAANVANAATERPPLNLISPESALASYRAR